MNSAQRRQQAMATLARECSGSHSAQMVDAAGKDRFSEACAVLLDPPSVYSPPSLPPSRQSRREIDGNATIWTALQLAEELNDGKECFAGCMFTNTTMRCTTLSANAANFVKEACWERFGMFAQQYLTEISIRTSYFLRDDLLNRLADSTQFPLVTSLDFDGDSFYWMSLLAVANVHSSQLKELSIDSGLTSVVQLPFDAFSLMTQLVTLNISGSDLTYLPGAIFANLTRLVTLDLSRNKLSILPPSLFTSLGSLETLIANGNALRVSVDTFASLPSLVNLILGYPQMASSLNRQRSPGLGNPLVSLPSGVFDKLTSLRYLALANCGIDSIPAGAFSTLPRLSVIFLDSNYITTLPGDLFAAQRNLTRVWLSNNDLVELPAKLFEGKHTLKELFVSGNNLRVLSEGFFDGLTSMRALSLTGNNIDRLPAGAFADMTQITGLWLNQNGMSLDPQDRQAARFDLLRSVEVLYLGSNFLTGLAADAFSHMQSLVFL